MAFVGLVRFFSLLVFYTDGRTPSTSDQPVERPLPTHRTKKHRINAHTHIHALSGIQNNMQLHISTREGNEACMERKRSVWWKY
jgi:hypothetical protein